MMSNECDQSNVVIQIRRQFLKDVGKSAIALKC